MFRSDMNIHSFMNIYFKSMNSYFKSRKHFNINIEYIE